MEQKLYATSDAMGRLGLSRTGLRYLEFTGKLSYERLGKGHHVYLRDEIERLRYEREAAANAGSHS